MQAESNPPPEASAQSANHADVTMLPPSSVDEPSTASTGATASTAFVAVHATRAALASRTSDSASLNLLNSAVQSLYHDHDQPTDSSVYLSRDRFRSLVTQIRQAAVELSTKNPALQQTSVTEQESSATSNAVRRYISLLSETSSHVTSLSHSIEAFSHPYAPSQKTGPTTPPPLPVSLHVGALSAQSNATDAPSSPSPLDCLDALCHALEAEARSLGLETFAEKHDFANQSHDTPHNTYSHTLTIGAKILVIDIEFGSTQLPSSSRPDPLVKLKLSYANDSAPSADGAPPLSRDPELGRVLQKDILRVAHLLLGSSTQSAASAQQLAAFHFNRLRSNLAQLVKLDELAAKSSESGILPQPDVFDAAQRLSAQILRLSEAERFGARRSLGTMDETTPAFKELMLTQGHGLISMHKHRPFLDIVYAIDDTSRTEYRISLQVGASGFSAQLPSSLRPSTSWPLADHAANLLQAIDMEPDPSTSLGSIIEGSKSTALHFLLALDPPVVVSRTTAARLATLCGLPRFTGFIGPTQSNRQPDPDQLFWFEDLLCSNWSSRSKPQASETLKQKYSYTLSRVPDSIRDPNSQGLLIDTLPFLSKNDVLPSSEATDANPPPENRSQPASIASRMFAAIELLRDEVRISEILHSALTSSAVHSQTGIDESDASLEDLLKSANGSRTAMVPVTMTFRYPPQDQSTVNSQKDAAPLAMDLGLSLPIKQGSPRARLDICITILPSATAAWTTDAIAKLCTGGSERSVSTWSDDSQIKVSWAQALSRKEIGGLTLVDQLLDQVIAWAQKRLDVKADLPESSVGSSQFDALAYEEKNVHEVYEAIAPHFSNTRYKPWPLIPLFLSTVPAGSIGADLGCGNGKYLPIQSTLSLKTSSDSREPNASDKQQQSLLTIGVDRSRNLVEIAQRNTETFETRTKPQSKGNTKPQKNEDAKAEIVENTVGEKKQMNEVAVGDAMMSGLRTGVFDFGISIATIHHFSTWERRLGAVQELIRLIQPVEPKKGNDKDQLGPDDSSSDDARVRLNGGSGRGRFMIFAWALEQRDEGKRQFEGVQKRSEKRPVQADAPTEQRDESRQVSHSGLSSKVPETIERTKDEQDLLVPWVLTHQAKASKRQVKTQKSEGENEMDRQTQALQVQDQEDSGAKAKKEDAPVYQRYYHVFRSGELEKLVEEAAEAMPVVHRRRTSSGQWAPQRVNVVCEANGWERGNWWGVWRVEWA